MYQPFPRKVGNFIFHGIKNAKKSCIIIVLGVNSYCFFNILYLHTNKIEILSPQPISVDKFKNSAIEVQIICVSIKRENCKTEIKVNTKVMPECTSFKYP